MSQSPISESCNNGDVWAANSTYGASIGLKFQGQSVRRYFRLTPLISGNNFKLFPKASFLIFCLNCIFDIWEILLEVIDSSKHRQQISLALLRKQTRVTEISYIIEFRQQRSRINKSNSIPYFGIIGMLNRAGTWTSR